MNTWILFCAAFIVPIGLFVSWLIPRKCKHCGENVWIGDRYVFHNEMTLDNFVHYNLHRKCADEHFA